MAQQTLHTVVTLGGHVDNSFGKIGDALFNMGSQVNLLSQKIIGFGKDSVETYVKYDDLMREVQAVGEFSDAEVKALDEINREIAKTTVYSNTQAAEAEVIMGQYGMSIADIKAMLPSVLDLAMAGNIEIKDSIDYLYSSLMSLGEGVDYAGVLTDQMAKTAAIGATDVDTLGDSLMRLGSGAQMFKGGSTEILTILTAMSRFGQDQRGAAAGTWIRNFMLSLAAPAGNIDDIVDAMEQLGVAEEEIAEYADNHSTGVTAAAVNSLVEDGLRIYDDAGNLLPAIEIIKSLRDTVRGSDEYADDLSELTGALAQSGGDIEAFMSSTEGLTDNALYGVFRQIFGRRGISTALNLIGITDEEWDSYWTDIVNSEGFAESMGETMQGGLGGALRELEASWGEFKTTFGETIAPVVEDVADWLSDIVTSLSEMDADSMNALVSGLAAIAAVGPGLMIVGGALKLIGFLCTPAGLITLAVTAIAGLTLYLTQLAETEWKGNFGTLELDLQELQSYADGVKTKFDNTITALSEFDTAIATTAENYQSLTTAFSSDLITAVLTNKELTEEDKTALIGYGENIIGTIKDGITLKKGEALQLTDILFGDMQTPEETDAFTSLVDWEDQYYQGLYGQAEAIGQKLRDALTEALQDGSLDEGDRMAIQAQVDRLNEIQAQIANAISQQEYYTQLHKAQSVSWDSVSEYLEGNEEAQATEIKALEDWWHRTYGEKRAAWQYNYDNAGTDAERQTLTEQWGIVESELNREYQEYVTSTQEKYGELARAAFDTLMNGSDYSDAWNFIKQVYADGAPTVDESGFLDFGERDWSKYFPNGKIPTLEDADDPNSMYNQLYKLWYAQKGITGLGDGLTSFLNPYMGYDEVSAIPGYIDAALALMDYTYTISQKQAEENNLVGSNTLVREDETPTIGEIDATAVVPEVTKYTAEMAREAISGAFGENAGDSSLFYNLRRGMEAESQPYVSYWMQNYDRFSNREQRQTWDDVVDQLKGQYDFSKVLAGDTAAIAQSRWSDQYAAYSLLYGKASENAEQYRIEAVVEADTTGAEAQIGELDGTPVSLDVDTDGLAPEGAEGIEIGAEVVGADDAAATANAGAQGVMDANPLGIDVNLPDGGALGSTFAANAQASLSANPGSYTVYIRTVGSLPNIKGTNRFGLFAEGGRTDEPAIFGEVPGLAEWAIPEEHSDRTAELLDAARAASGFTWPELISRNGGLNANPNQTPTQIVYSPTIYATDAQGVEEKLKEDKERLDKWWSEKRLHDEVEVYS
ncbi:MAG: phage tail tape measure protein [Eubacteriales bacterium]|nr:phage tail tape measure protein [Eubacteriales bacterium]MDD4512867.1 phage tail tape measure protein [Eubacteriales bacterium]